MENFTAYNPTKLRFGKNVIAMLPDTLQNTGKNVLLITGQGSVKKYGYYDQQKLLNLWLKNKPTGMNIILDEKDYQKIISYL